MNLFKCALLVALAYIVSGKPTTNARPSNFNVVKFLDQVNADLPSSLRNQKYTQMEASEFIFYRGANPVYFRDMANNPAITKWSSAQTTTFMMGDLHIENYGAFDTDDGEIVYELNDFDESTPYVTGGHVHDVVKLAASVILASKELKADPSDSRQYAELIAGEYADQVQEYAKADESEPDKALWTVDHKTSGKLKAFLQETGKDSAEKARTKMLDKYTVKSNGSRKFQTNNPDLRAVTTDEKNRVIAAIAKYKSTVESSIGTKYSDFFKVADVAVRLFAGTGSLGKMRYYVLVHGETDDADDDVLLDVKQQGEWPTPLLFASASERAAHRAAFKNEGERVQVAYKALSTKVDDTIGYVDIAIDVGRTTSTVPFSVRQRSPFKETFPYIDLKTSNSDWTQMCKEWAKILATHHCRADSRFRSGLYAKSNFAVALDKLVSGNMDSFVTDIADLADMTAVQAARDYIVFKRDNGVAARMEWESEETESPSSADVDASVASSLVHISISFIIARAVLFH